MKINLKGFLMVSMMTFALIFSAFAYTSPPPVKAEKAEINHINNPVDMVNRATLTPLSYPVSAENSKFSTNHDLRISAGYSVCAKSQVRNKSRK